MTQANTTLRDLIRKRRAALSQPVLQPRSVSHDEGEAYGPESGDAATQTAPAQEPTSPLRALIAERRKAVAPVGDTDPFPQGFRMFREQVPGMDNRVGATADAAAVGLASGFPLAIEQGARLGQSIDAAQRNPIQTAGFGLSKLATFLTNPGGVVAGTPPVGLAAQMTEQGAGAVERGVMSLPHNPPGLGAAVTGGIANLAGESADDIAELAPPKVHDTFSPESIAFNAAQSIPQMVGAVGASMIGGAAGGPAGAFAGAFGASMGAETASIVDDTYKKLKQTNPEMSDDEALQRAFVPAVLAAIPAAALDAGTGGEAAAGRAMVEKNAEAVAKSLTRRVLSGGKTLLEAMAEEGLTEPIQGIVEDIGTATASPNKDVPTGQDVRGFATKRAMESVVGGLMGGGGGSIEAIGKVAGPGLPKKGAAKQATPTTRVAPGAPSGTAPAAAPAANLHPDVASFVNDIESRLAGKPRADSEQTKPTTKAAVASTPSADPGPSDDATSRVLADLGIDPAAFERRVQEERDKALLDVDPRTLSPEDRQRQQAAQRAELDRRAAAFMESPEFKAEEARKAEMLRMAEEGRGGQQPRGGDSNEGGVVAGGVRGPGPVEDAGGVGVGVAEDVRPVEPRVAPVVGDQGQQAGDQPGDVGIGRPQAEVAPDHVVKFFAGRDNAEMRSVRNWVEEGVTPPDDYAGFVQAAKDYPEAFAAELAKRNIEQPQQPGAVTAAPQLERTSNEEGHQKGRQEGLLNDEPAAPEQGETGVSPPLPAGAGQSAPSVSPNIDAMGHDELKSYAKSIGVPPRGSPDGIRARIRKAHDAQLSTTANPTKVDSSPSKGRRPEYDALPAMTRENFESAFAARDVGRLAEYLDPSNKTLRREFAARAGLDRMPPGVARTRAAVEAWASAEDRQQPIASPQSATPRRSVGNQPERASSSPRQENESGSARSALSTVDTPSSGEMLSSPDSTPKPSGFLSNLSAADQARAEELRARLAKKLAQQRSTLSMNAGGFDPEMLSLGAEYAALHIKAGAKRFAVFAREMVGQLGDGIQPYLRALYSAARQMPGMDRTGTDSADYVDGLTDDDIGAMVGGGNDAEEGRGVAQSQGDRPQDTQAAGEVGGSARTLDDIAAEFRTRFRQDYTPENLAAISALRKEAFDRFGVQALENLPTAKSPPRDVATIEREIAAIQKRVDNLHANYRGPGRGGTRAKTTTYNANVGRLSESIGHLKDEMNRAREATASRESGQENAKPLVTGGVDNQNVRTLADLEAFVLGPSIGGFRIAPSEADIEATFVRWSKSASVADLESLSKLTFPDKAGIHTHFAASKVRGLAEAALQSTNTSNESRDAKKPRVYNGDKGGMKSLGLEPANQIRALSPTKRSGWHYVETPDGAALVDPFDDYGVRFVAENERSGADLLRARTEARAYADDHHVEKKPWQMTRAEFERDHPQGKMRHFESPSSEDKAKEINAAIAKSGVRAKISTRQDPRLGPTTSIVPVPTGGPNPSMKWSDEENIRLQLALKDAGIGFRLDPDTGTLTNVKISREFDMHERQVRRANAEGLPVPDAVRKEYGLPHPAGELVVKPIVGDPGKSPSAPLQRAREARANKVLDEQMMARSRGKVMTRRELVDAEIAEGATPTIQEVEDAAAVSKAEDTKKIMDRRIVPTGNPNHPETIRYRELEATIKNPPTKPEYRMVKDGSWRVLTKVEYDYAVSKKLDAGEQSAAKQNDPYAADIEKLTAILRKQVATEASPRRQGQAAIVVLNGEAPAVQKAVAKVLWEIAPDAAEYVASDGPIGMRGVVQKAKPDATATPAATAVTIVGDAEKINLDDGTSFLRHTLSDGTRVDEHDAGVEHWRPVGPGRQSLGQYATVDEALMAANESRERPATASPQTGRTGGRDVSKSIGVNPDGNPIFEDSRGVRSYVESGVKIAEPVRMGPRGEFAGIGARGDEFKTSGEIAADNAPGIAETTLTQAAKPQTLTAGAANAEQEGRVRSDRPERSAGKVGGAPDEVVEGVSARPVRGVREGGSSDASSEGAGAPGRDGVRRTQGVGNEPRTGDGHGGARDAVAADAQRAARVASPSAEKAPGHNYQITPDDKIGDSWSPKARYRSNIEAIKTLKAIEAEGRRATPEEQRILVQYVGWGGLKQVFSTRGEDHKGWTDEIREVKALLTPDEHSQASASVQNAHFTSAEVISAMWGGIRVLGFTGGHVHEPAMGVGHFFGLMPQELAERSSLSGGERDSISARISQQLYQHAAVRHVSFEDSAIPQNSVDLFISNVPFAKPTLVDPGSRELTALQAPVHDFFFSKAIDRVRPGGLVAFITSRFSMDKATSKFRRWWSDRANLVGIIRLPNNAFKGIANTEVVTDIVLLQKRMPGVPAPKDVSWTDRADITTDDGHAFKINAYLAQHPEMVLGKNSAAGTMRSENEYTVEPAPERGGLGYSISRAFRDRIRFGVDHEALAQSAEKQASAREVGGDAGGEPELSTVVKGGKVWTVENGQLVAYPDFPADTKGTWARRVDGVIGVRDVANRLIKSEMDPNAPEGGIEDVRKALNRVYDRFVEKHGPISKEVNRRFFRDDPSLGTLLALEDYDSEAGTASKAAIFSKRLNFPHTPITKAENAEDALRASLSERGRVDLPWMAEIVGKPAGEIESALRDRVFAVPGGGYETREQYLSGNVREKLRAAKAAASENPTYERNVEALEKVQPEDVPPGSINATPGVTWLEPTDYQDFAKELVGRKIGVQYVGATGKWLVDGAGLGATSIAETVDWGTADRPALDLLQRLLNHSEIKVTRQTRDGTVVDVEASKLAEQKAKLIEEKFTDWVFQDPERSKRLVRVYNDLFNAMVHGDYDGSHMELPGMSEQWRSQLLPHQRAAIWRIVTTGNTLLAHVVGAGKTAEMIGAAMEMKRMGLARRPMFVVPNHLVEQWVRSIKDIYPAARVLAPTAKDFTGLRRRRTMARIRTGEFDMVVMPFSQFRKVPVSIERINTIFQREIRELESAMYAAKQEKGKSGKNFISELEAAKERLQNLWDKQRAEWNKDPGIPFEETGVDALFVDEAHEFKNLYFKTNMRRIPGIAPQIVQKSFDLLVKTEYLNELTGGRGVVFGTGTPIANSMTEMFTMMRYLAPGVLQQARVDNFDAWASAFGKVTSQVEVRPDGGGFRLHSRFNRFVNLPELTQMFRTFTDVKMKDDLKLPTPDIASGRLLGLESVAGPRAVTITRSDELAGIVNSLVARAKAITQGEVDPSEDNMLAVTGDGKRAALDLRLYDAGMPDLPDSKVNTAVKNIHTIWERSKDLRGAQIVWSDLGVPRKDRKAKAVAAAEDAAAVADTGGIEEDSDGRETGFDLYGDIKKKLVKAGIPADQIAFIHEADTDAKRGKLFAAVNKGDVRVLIASTPKLGTGANVQQRLVAAHHLDAPWKPAEVEQRDGRIVRQGNLLWKEHKTPVEIYRYITEGSFDAYSWQTLEQKATFIAQAMAGSGDKRELSGDLGKQALEFSQMKAAAANNPKLFRFVALQGEVEELRQKKRAHDAQAYTIKSQVDSLPGTIRFHEKQGAARADDAAYYRRESADELSVKIDGRTLEGKDAAEALTAAVEALQQQATDAGKVSAERDVEVYGAPAKLRGWTKVAGQGEKRLVLQRSAEWGIELSGSPEGNTTRIRNRIAAMASEAAYSEGQAREAKKRLADLQDRTVGDFPQEVEYRSKKAELDTLDAEIKAEAAAEKRGGATSVPEADPNAPPGAVSRSAADRLDAFASERFKSAMRKLGVGGGVVFSGVDPTAALDLAAYIAAKLTVTGIRGGRELTKFVADAVAQLKAAGNKSPALDDLKAIRKAVVRLYRDAGRREAVQLDPTAIIRAYAANREALDRRRTHTVGKTIGDTAAVKNAVADQVRERPEVSKPGEKRETRLLNHVQQGENREASARQAGEDAGFRQGLTVGEQVGERKTRTSAAREIVRSRRDAFKTGVAEARATIPGLVRKLREEQKRQRQTSEIERRGAVDATKAVHEQEASIREGIRKMAQKLPMAVRGNFLTAVESAKSPLHLARAVRDMSKALSRYEATKAARGASMWAKPAKIKRLTNDERAIIRGHMSSVHAAWQTVKAKGTNADKMYEAARAIEDSYHAIKAIYAQHYAETRAIKSLRGQTAKEAASEAVANIERAGKPMKPSDMVEDVEASKLTQLRRGFMDLRNATESVEGKHDGDGVLYRLMHRAMTWAEDAYFSEKRKRFAQVEKAVKAAGLDGLADAFEKLTGAGGRALQQTITATLGGAQRTISLGQALSLAAIDPSTEDLIGRGMKVQMSKGRFLVPMAVTMDEVNNLRLRLSLEHPKMLDMVKAFKGIMEEMRPAVFKVHRVLKGFEPEIVHDRWPRVRNLSAGDKTQSLPESSHELVNRVLENSGFLKERTGGTDAPMLVDDVLNVVFDQIDQAAKVTHLALPVRDAASVLLDSKVRTAIASRWGGKFYTDLKKMLMASSRANQVLNTPGARFVSGLNANLAVSALASNVGTYLRQIAGLTRLMPYMSLADWLHGVAHVPKVSTKEMTDASGYLWERYIGGPAGRMSPVMGDGAEAMDNPGIGRAMKQTVANVKAGDLGAAYKAWQRGGKAIMEGVNVADSVVARAAWAGFMRQAEREHPNWAKRQKLAWVADQTADVVRETQNGSSALDLSINSTMARDSGMAAFFLFTSDPLKARNRIARAYKKSLAEGAKQTAAEAASILLGMAMARGAGWAISQGVSAALGGDDRDRKRITALYFAPERILANAAREVAGDVAPILGPALTDLLTSSYNRGGGFDPPVLRAINDIADSVGSIKTAVMTDRRRGEKMLKALEKFASAVMTVGGVNPFQSLWRTVWGEAKRHIQ